MQIKFIHLTSRTGTANLSGTPSSLCFNGLRFALSFVFCVVFCRDHCLSFFFWPLHFLSFFDLPLLITPLVSLYFSYLKKDTITDVRNGKILLEERYNYRRKKWQNLNINKQLLTNLRQIGEISVYILITNSYWVSRK